MDAKKRRRLRKLLEYDIVYPVDPLVTDYIERVEADGGTVEAEDCLNDLIKSLK